MCAESCEVNAVCDSTVSQPCKTHACRQLVDLGGAVHLPGVDHEIHGPWSPSGRLFCLAAACRQNLHSWNNGSVQSGIIDDMLSALKKAVSRSKTSGPDLIGHYIDAPTPGLTIDRPELKVGGWLVFNQALPSGTLEVVLEAGELRFPLALRQRPDVEAAHPGRHCVGFHQFIDLNSDLSNALDLASQRLCVSVVWPEGRFEIPLEVSVLDGYQNASSYFQNELKYSATDDVSHEQIEHWRNSGYLLLPGFVAEDIVDRINADIDLAWQDRADYPETVTVDQKIGTSEEQRLALRDTDPSVRKSPYKLNDLYQESGAIRDAVMSDQIMRVLKPLIGGTPMICNSLSFEYGSQQPHHFDTFYMPPTVRNQMLATWVALEDVHQEAGPLEYFPGSHKIEPYRALDGSYNMTSDERGDFDKYIATELDREGLEQQTFCAKKGDVFIWHAHLFHGGSQIIDKTRTRKSVVTHYFCQEDWPREAYEEFAPGRCYLKR